MHTNNAMADQEPCLTRFLSITLGLAVIGCFVWATFGAAWWFLFIWLYTAITVVYMILGGGIKSTLTRTFGCIFYIISGIFLAVLLLVFILLIVGYARYHNHPENITADIAQTCGKLPTDADQVQCAYNFMNSVDLLYSSGRFAVWVIFFLANIIQ